ncbi:MAG: radical SAM protein, partial [Nanoarchaeota archaeon]
MSYFALSDKVYWVKGAIRGAIYDTNKGDVFSINREAKDCLDALVGGKTVAEAVHEFDNRADDVLTWLRQLEQNSLGSFTEEKLPIQDFPQKPKQELDFMWLELTRGCNLRCLHCYDDSCPELIETEKALTERMLHDDWLRVIDQAAEEGFKRLQFIGGEPLLYKEIFGLVEDAKR